MTLNKKLIQKIQIDANEMGVVLASPNYILQLDPTSQNQIIFNATQEIIRLAREG